ncbi:T9SS type A sorting domain-containing protein [Chryseobacterium terrae]|uniref:T9SS type A sorting domain-containing protein n=1 Tax=Chryseobacterium terrae TaxID=3163299 RepID=A0ABW8Y0Z7_9FLAO
MRKFYFVLFLTLASAITTKLFAQYSCAGAVPITNGFTATNITTSGTNSWVTESPDCGGGYSSTVTGSTTCFDDVFETTADDYVFSYTTGSTAGESVSFEILAKKSYMGLLAFSDCNGTVFSGCLSGAYAAALSGSTSSTLRVTAANLPANKTIYFAVGLWAPPNDLSFDVTNFTVTPASLSVNETEKKDNIDIYPNPVNDVLNFSNLQETAEVSIYSLEGRKILGKQIQAGESLNVSQLQKGTYTVKLVSQDKVKTYKIIKK